MFLHFLINLSMLCNNDQSEFLIDFEKFQPLKEVLGSGLLSFHFCFESNSSIDTMIKMPPATQKVLFVPHEIDGIGKDVLSGWIIQHVMEFIYANRFNQWKLDFWNGF